MKDKKFASIGRSSFWRAEPKLEGKWVLPEEDNNQSVLGQSSQTSEHPGISFVETLIEVTSLLLYVAGMIIIEMYLKPRFGANGMPLVCNWILIIAEICMLFKLVWRLFKIIDAFVKDFSESNISKIIYKKIMEAKYRNNQAKKGDKRVI